MKKSIIERDGSYQYQFGVKEIKAMFLEKYPEIPKDKINEIGFIGDGDEDADEDNDYFFIEIGGDKK